MTNIPFLTFFLLFCRNLLEPLIAVCPIFPQRNIISLDTKAKPDQLNLFAAKLLRVGTPSLNGTTDLSCLKPAYVPELAL